MKIGFDATPISSRKTGIGYYAENLLRGLATQSGLDELLLFSNREPIFDGQAPDGVRWCSRNAFPYRAPWLQFLLPGLIRREKPDLTHYVNFNAPVLHRHPFVVTFHDMVLYRHPEFYTWKKRILTRSLMPWVARRALGVITVSQTVKSEMVEQMALPEEKVFVVPNAAGDQFRPIEDQEEKARVLRRHGITSPYILFVGTLEPRKNLGRLLPAFDRLKTETNLPHQLAVVGGRGWKFGPIFQNVDRLRHRDSVRFLDYVDLDELPALYSGADLFVFPSIYEGFGIPMVEAMRCGAPVLASDIPVLREVAGEAAEYCDPGSVDSIATALRRCLENAELRETLTRSGIERAGLYSWERAAREVAEVYRTVLGRAGADRPTNR